MICFYLLIDTVTIYKDTMIKVTTNKPINRMGIGYDHWGCIGMGYKIIFYKDVPCLYSPTLSNHLNNNPKANGV
jgi:hypothetical protein